jgi:hypothetical protein
MVYLLTIRKAAPKVWDSIPTYCLPIFTIRTDPSKARRRVLEQTSSSFEASPLGISSTLDFATSSEYLRRPQKNESVVSNSAITPLMLGCASVACGPVKNWLPCYTAYTFFYFLSLTSNGGLIIYFVSVNNNNNNNILHFYEAHFYISTDDQRRLLAHDWTGK